MSKQRQELQTRLNALKGTGMAIVTAAETDDRDLTDEETAQISAIESEAEEINASLAALDARDAARRSMNALGGSTALTPAGQVAVNDLDPEATHGFKDIAEFSHSVRSASVQGGTIDDRLNGPGMSAAPTGFHQGGGDAGEGFSVPPAYRDEIFEVMEAVDEFSGLVDEEPTDKREVKTVADETTPWGATGVQARWRSEGSQMSPSQMSDQSRTVPLHEMYAFVLATGELLEDSPRLANRLTRRAGEAIAWKRNNSMVDGTGAGQPLGWHNAGNAALITVAKESGQTAATINAQNVLKMMTRLYVLPGDQPFWLANRNIIPQLATMTIGDQPVWMPPAGLAAAPGGFLLGYPVRFSEHANSLGSRGDLQLISPRGYYALRRDAGPALARSMHLYFDYNIEAFRWLTRFGGQPHLSAPVVPPTAAGGSANSKSNFVTLAERA